MSTRRAAWPNALLALTFGVAAAGCNCGGPSGTDDTDVLPQEPDPHDNGEQPPTCSLTVVEMLPAPDSTVAVPKSTVEIEFSEPIDASTVTATSVVLRERESNRIVPTTQTVNGAHLMLVPLRPLSTRYRYTVDVGEVASVDDADCTVDYSARFFTVPNFETLYLRHIDGIENRAAVYTWDEEAAELAVDFYVPGPDGELLTDDDIQDVRSVYYYDKLGDVTHTFVWNGAGADSLWATGDDMHWFGQSFSHVAEGVDTYHVVWHGADGIVGTADDTESLLDSYMYDDEDAFSGYCNDDGCLHVLKGANEKRHLSLVGAGPDGEWLTSDDVLGPEWTRTVTDHNGDAIGTETHLTASDGTATVTPTSLKAYSKITVTDGQTTEIRAYVGAGPDAIWHTADDVGDIVTTIEYDSDGLRTGKIAYLAGPDGLFGTADDLLYQEFFY